MKKSDVKKIVEANIEGMKTMLGLERWLIDIEYVGGKSKELRNSGFNGQCRTDINWVDKALIIFVPRKLDDEAEVLSVLQHELVHCITAASNLGMTAMAKLVSKKEYQALLVLHYRADEEITEWICKILDSLKPFPVKENCMFCQSKHSPDNVLIPFSMCNTCGRGMLTRILEAEAKAEDTQKKSSQDAPQQENSDT